MFATHSSALAQYAPQKLNISGVLYSPGGSAVTQASVDFKIEVLDKAATCVLYSEDHLGVNLSSSKGAFSLEVGSGTSKQNFLQATTALGWRVFENTGINTGAFSGCAGGVTMSPGEERMIRVSYNLGSGMTALTPNVPITAASYALVAETLQGKTASDFIQVKDDVSTDLNQSNVETVFSATNYAKLLQLLNNTFTGSYSFNNQRVTGVATPTASTDAVNKGWTDAHVGDKSADLSGVGSGIGNGKTLVWDATLGQWTTASPSATDNTKLPLAGGTMSGGITMAGYDLYNTGHITIANQRLLQLGTYTGPQEGALALTGADAGKILYNTTANTVRLWNGSAFTGFVPAGAAGGDLTGYYPSPLIATSAVTTTKIANDAVTSAKINNTGIASSRLISTDATTGTTLTYVGCALNEVMTFDAAGKWTCTTVQTLTGNSGVTAGAYGSATTVPRFGVNALGAVTMAVDVPIGFPVTSVAGKTGAVTLNAADIGGLGTAALQDVGTSAGNVPQLDAGGKILVGLLPSIPTTLINQQGASSGQVLKWNGSSWMPANDTDTGVTSVVAGTALQGGGSTPSVTINLADTAVTTGSYGSASQVSTFTVDQQGRLTAAGQTTIAINPTQINQYSASTNQVLKWNGSAWLPAADVDTGITTLSGDVTASGSGSVAATILNDKITSAKINSTGIAINRLLITNPTDGATINYATCGADGQVLKYNSSTGWACANDAGAAGVLTQIDTGPGLVGGPITSSGSISLATTSVTPGSYGSAASVSTFTVDNWGRLTAASNTNIALPTTQINQQGASTNQVLKWNGTAWFPANDADTGIISVVAGTALTGGGTSSAVTLNLANTAVTTGSYGSASQVSTFTVDQQGRLTAAGQTNIAIEPNAINQHGASTNDVLKWNGSAWAPASVTSGTVTLVSAGTGLTGGNITNAGTLSLTNTGVTAASYGSAASVGTFTVDAQGRLTAATDTPIALPTTQINQQGASTNQVLKWNGSAWLPANDTDTGIATLVQGNGILLSGTATTQTIAVDTGITANKILQLDSNGALGIGTVTVATGAALDIWGATSSNSAVVLPRATTANRPTSAINGMIRYNTNLAKFEVYENSNWVNMVGGGAADNLGNHTATTAILAVTGTAATPSYSFNGDTDTGLWAVGPNQIAAGTGGTERVRIDSSGNVGIGTSSPTRTLEVSTSATPANSVLFTANNGTNVATLDFSHVGLQVARTSTNSYPTMLVTSGDNSNSRAVLQLQGNGGTNQVLFAASSGNVGIGTTTPAALLDVYGTGGIIVPRATTAQRPFGVNGMIRYNTNNAKFEVYENNNWQNVVTGTAPGDNLGNHTATSAILAITGTAATPSYSFNGDTDTGFSAIGSNQIAASTGGTERVRIDSSGNVGIGTTTPSFPLDVVSTGNHAARITASPGMINLILDKPSTNPMLMFSSAGVSKHVIYYDVSAGAMKFRDYVAGVDRMTIDSAGNVGIGTTTPSASLDVYGTGSASAAILPRDTQANRPTGVNGMIRYNTNNNKFEAFQNGGWLDVIGSGGGGSGAVASMVSGLPDYIRCDVTSTVSMLLSISQVDTSGDQVTYEAGGFYVTFVLSTGAYDSNYNLYNGGTHDCVGPSLSALESSGLTFKLAGGGGNIWTQSGNDAIVTPAGNVGIGTTTPAARLDVYGTGAASAVIIPRDTTANRPTGLNGMIRYNTNLAKFEVYENDNWVNMVGGGAGDNLGNHTATSAILATAGTGASPGYSFSGDTDTGMWRVGNNQMALSTGGNERVRIDSSGNVGIGATPSYPFHVVNTQTVSSAGTYPSVSVDQTVDPGSSTGANYLGTKVTSNNIASSMTTGEMTGLYSLSKTSASASGNLNRGILAEAENASSPTLTALIGLEAKANKTGTSNTTSAYGVYSKVINANSTGTISDGFGVYVDLTNTGPVTNYYGLYISDEGTGANYYSIYTGSTKVYFGGNVGVGTTTPAARLDIFATGSGAGSALIVPRDTTAFRPTGVNGMIRYNTNLAKFEVYENNNWVNMVGGGAADNLGNHTATSAILAVTGTAATPSYAFGAGSNRGMYAVGTGGVAFSTASLERLRINPNGNVGIGTSSPTADLEVQGQIVSKEYVVASGGAANFANGNAIVLSSVGSSTITVSNMVAGGVYNVIVEDTTSRTYTFSGCGTSYFSPTNGATSSRTVYTIYRRSTTACYITWTTGF